MIPKIFVVYLTVIDMLSAFNSSRDSLSVALRMAAYGSSSSALIYTDLEDPQATMLLWHSGLDEPLSDTWAIFGKITVSESDFQCLKCRKHVLLIYKRKHFFDVFFLRRKAYIKVCQGGALRNHIFKGGLEVQDQQEGCPPIDLYMGEERIRWRNGCDILREIRQIKREETSRCEVKTMTVQYSEIVPRPPCLDIWGQYQRLNNSSVFYCYRVGW